MLTSRRNILRALGAGAAIGAAARSVTAFSLFEPGSSDQPTASAEWIHLDKNENPYGPAQKVSIAMQSGLSVANRFPEMELTSLVDSIAQFHTVGREQVILGCGSTDILRMCCGAFLGSGKKLAMATPGFEPMARYARRSGADVQVVPLTKMYAHNLAAMAQRMVGGPGLIYICNPHNPTGTLSRRKDVEALLHALPANVFVVIDEAYHHYVAPSPAYASFIDRPLNDPRVIVTRTFSKIYGLAGMRIGYGISAPETAQRIRAYRLIDAINVSAARAARMALEADDYIRTCAQRNADHRQEFYNQANARMLRWIDSQTNFVLLNTGRSGVEVAQTFRSNNVLVASSFPSMENYVRVTVGTREEMKEFWRVWDQQPQQNMAM